MHIFSLGDYPFQERHKYHILQVITFPALSWHKEKQTFLQYSEYKEEQKRCEQCNNIHRVKQFFFKEM